MSEHVFARRNSNLPAWLSVLIAGLAFLFAAAAILAVVLVPNPAYVIIAAIVVPLVATIFMKPEVGLAVLLFVTFSRAFEVIMENQGALSPYTFFMGFLVLVLAVRRIFIREKIDGWQTAALLFGSFSVLGLSALLYADYPDTTMQNLVYLAKDSLMVLLVVVLIKDGVSLRWAVWGLLAAGILLGTVSTIQQATGSFENTFGGFGEIKIANIYENVQGSRMGGPGIDPNVYGQYMLILLPLAWDRIFNEKKAWLRVVAGWTFFVSLVAIIFTFSRGNFIGLVIVLAALLVLRPPRLAVWIIGLVIFLALIPYIPQEYTQRLVTLTYVLPDFNSSDNELMPNVNKARQEISFRGRLSENLVGLQMSMDHPLLGVGYGNFKDHYQSYSRKLGLDPRREGRSAHNLYLETFAEMGILGLFWLFILNLVTYRGLWRSTKIFNQIERPDLAGIPVAVMVSIAGLLITSIFLHMVYPRYFWMVYALALGVPNAADKELNRAFIKSKWNQFRGSLRAGEQHA